MKSQTPIIRQVYHIWGGRAFRLPVFQGRLPGLHERKVSRSALFAHQIRTNVKVIGANNRTSVTV